MWSCKEYKDMFLICAGSSMDFGWEVHYINDIVYRLTGIREPRLPLHPTTGFRRLHRARRQVQLESGVGTHG